MRSFGLAGLLVLAALVGTASAASNMCVNEGDLLASQTYWWDQNRTCQDFSADYENFGLDWSAASVCDDLKTLSRNLPNEGPGVMWEWQLTSGARCCGSWDKAKCLLNVTLDTCDGAYVKFRELTGAICRKTETDHKYTEASCGTDACKAVISSLDDAVVAKMQAGLQVRGARGVCMLLSLSLARALSLSLFLSLSLSFSLSVSISIYRYTYRYIYGYRYRYI